MFDKNNEQRLCKNFLVLQDLNDKSYTTYLHANIFNENSSKHYPNVF